MTKWHCKLYTILNENENETLTTKLASFFLPLVFVVLWKQQLHLEGSWPHHHHGIRLHSLDSSICSSMMFVIKAVKSRQFNKASSANIIICHTAERSVKACYRESNKRLRMKVGSYEAISSPLHTGHFLWAGPVHVLNTLHSVQGKLTLDFSSLHCIVTLLVHSKLLRFGVRRHI